MMYSGLTEPCWRNWRVYTFDDGEKSIPESKLIYFSTTEFYLQHTEHISAFTYVHMSVISL